jgi:hypothetical protein
LLKFSVEQSLPLAIVAHDDGELIELHDGLERVAGWPIIAANVRSFT